MPARGRRLVDSHMSRRCPLKFIGTGEMSDAFEPLPIPTVSSRGFSAMGDMLFR